MNSEQIEKKRQDEIRLISEMISLYCKKKHGTIPGHFAENVRRFRTMPYQGLPVAPLWKKRVSAVIARYTAIRRKCGRRFGRSCG